MANLKISELTDGSTAASDDRIAVARNPGGSTTSRYITPAYIFTYGVAANWTVSADWTFSSALLTQGSGSAFDAASVLGHCGGDGTLHVHTASSGTVTAATDSDDLTIENSTDAGLSILTPNTDNGRVTFGDPDNNDAGEIVYSHTDDAFYFGANGTQSWAFDHNGGAPRTGLGTLAPAAKVHIMTDYADAVAEGTPVANGDDFMIEGATNCGMTILTANDQVSSIFFGDEDDADVAGIAYNHSNNSFAITANTNTKFVFNSTGALFGRNATASTSLQVGTTSSGITPAAATLLMVEGSGNASITIGAGTSSNATLNFGDSGDEDAGYILYNHSTNHLVFKNNGTEHAQINDTGHLQVDPSGTFSLVGNSYHTLQDNDNNSGAINTVMVNGGANTDNTSSFLLSCSTGAADRLYIYGNGNVVNTNNSYGALSDKKLKKDIKYERSQWDDIKALKLAKYTMKDDPSERRQIGLIAQDVEKVSPGLVHESPRPGHNDIVKTINYSVLWLKALGALQEAMERIEELEKRV